MFGLFSNPEKQFWKAIHENDVVQVAAMVRRGVDVNTCRVPNGNITMTPLHIAANGGREKIVEVLLKLGAKVDPRNEDGDTPLHLASSFRSLIGGTTDHLVVKLLLAHGANVNSVNSEENTPLHLNALITGVAKGSSYAKSAQLLIAHGADVHIMNKASPTRTPFDLASQSNRAEIMEAIAGRGSPEDNNRILYWAVYRENQPVFELALSKGADVNTTSSRDRHTPLHAAATSSRIAMIDLLVGKGANVNAIDDSGKTPLHLVVSSNTSEAGVKEGKPAVVERLIKFGANVNATDKHGMTVLKCLGTMEGSGGVWAQMEQILRQHGART